MEYLHCTYSERSTLHFASSIPLPSHKVKEGIEKRDSSNNNNSMNKKLFDKNLMSYKQYYRLFEEDNSTGKVLKADQSWGDHD